jgi:hypothetical protein
VQLGTDLTLGKLSTPMKDLDDGKVNVKNTKPTIKVTFPSPQFEVTVNLKDSYNARPTPRSK